VGLRYHLFLEKFFYRYWFGQFTARNWRIFITNGMNDDLVFDLRSMSSFFFSGIPLGTSSCFFFVLGLIRSHWWLSFRFVHIYAFWVMFE